MIMKLFKLLMTLEFFNDGFILAYYTKINFINLKDFSQIKKQYLGENVELCYCFYEM